MVSIMNPWNYPFLLTMEPLMDALAADNTAIVKSSAYSRHHQPVHDETTGFYTAIHSVQTFSGAPQQ